MNVAKNSMYAGMGTQTAGLISGGNLPPTTTGTEGYDGSTWSTRPNMSTARQQGSGLGTNSTDSAGLAATGYTGTAATAATEEFTGTTETVTAKTLTTS